MTLQQIGEWLKSLLKFATGAVKTLAPAAQAVGAATGNKEVVDAAKLAEASATAVDKAMDEAEREK